MSDWPRGQVPPGDYAGGGRSPVVWVLLCAGCAGFAPTTPPEYYGRLSGQCTGCGVHTRELHRFPALINSARGCSCGGHEQIFGDVAATDGGGLNA